MIYVNKVLIVQIIIIIFLIYKLLTFLVDSGSKPTCPEREVNYTEHSQGQTRLINTGKTVYVGNACIKNMF